MPPRAATTEVTLHRAYNTYKMNKIKILQIATALVCSATPAFAVDMLDTSAPKQLVEVNVHAGIGTSTIINNYGSVAESITAMRLSPGTRLMAGFGAEMPLRDYISVGTGLDFAINNYSLTMTMLDGYDGTLGTLLTANHYYTLEVPVYVAMRLNLGSRVRWCNELGAYFAYGMGGSSKTTAFVSSTNSLGQSQVSEAQYNRKYYESDDPVFCTMRCGDLGLHIATGILINHHFTVKASLHVGIRDIAKNFGVFNAHAHTLAPTFLLGYNF